MSTVPMDFRAGDAVLTAKVYRRAWECLMRETQGPNHCTNAGYEQCIECAKTQVYNMPQIRGGGIYDA